MKALLVGLTGWQNEDRGQVLRLTADGGSWDCETVFAGRNVSALAVDPGRPQRVLCGTDGAGLWLSEDGGVGWRPVGEASLPRSVTALAWAPVGDGPGTAWAGTEPSAVYRSDDGGNRWYGCGSLTALPSAPTWSFPPRPGTSHVKVLAVCPHDSERLWASVEQGGIVTSDDGGRTWHDRRPGSPLDAHGLTAHPLAPSRLYAANGDGAADPRLAYAESRDGGRTWIYTVDGLRHPYLWDVAVDPGAPDTVLVSAASAPARLDATVYRRQDGSWREVTDGLPAPVGSTPAVFATAAGLPGLIFAASNRGVFRSVDSGETWTALPCARLAGAATQMARAVAVVP